MIDPRDLPKINACPPYTATDLVRALIGSRKTSSLCPVEIVRSLTIGGWMHHHHNTGDLGNDTQTAKDAVKRECIALAKELDERLEQLASLENAMLDS